MLAELLTLLLSPVVRLLRRRRASPEEIKRFYRSAEWRRARYETLRDLRTFREKTGRADEQPRG